jgi:hypothetical protein
LLGIHLCGSWPYVASLIACYPRTITRYSQLILFVLVLTAATIAGIASYVGTDGFRVRGIGVLGVTTVQFALFFAARAALTRPIGDAEA